MRGRSHRSSRAAIRSSTARRRCQAPGPGAYNSTSSFKAALTRDILGASSALKSGTSRLFSSEGRVIDKYLQPGVPLSETRVGTHDPRNPSKPTIGGAVQAVREQLRKVQQIRAGKARPPTTSPSTSTAAASSRHGADQPGRARTTPTRTGSELKKRDCVALPPVAPRPAVGCHPARRRRPTARARSRSSRAQPTTARAGRLHAAGRL